MLKFDLKILGFFGIQSPAYTWQGGKISHMSTFWFISIYLYKNPGCNIMTGGEINWKKVSPARVVW